MCDWFSVVGNSTANPLTRSVDAISVLSNCCGIIGLFVWEPSACPSVLLDNLDTAAEARELLKPGVVGEKRGDKRPGDEWPPA
jgi:hypothetical protein